MRRIRFQSLLVIVSLFSVLSGCAGATAEEHVANAQTQLAENDFNTALIELKNAVQKNPDSAEARALLARVHLRLGDFPGALKESERALDLGRDDNENLWTLYRAKLGLGAFSEVIGALEEETTLEPMLAIVLADAYLIAGDVEKAKQMMAQGAHLADGLYGLARLAQMENDAPRALRFLKQAIDKDPTHTQAWLLRGEVELAQGDLETALNSFQQASALPSGQVLGAMGVVRTQLLSGDVDAAADGAERLVGMVSEFPPARYLLGLIRFRQGDLEASMEELRQVQSRVPEHGPTRYLIGVVLAQLGSYNQAIENLTAYLAVDPNNVSARKILGAVFVETNDLEAAITTLQPAAVVGADPQVWAMLGNAQLRSGNMSDATESFQKAVELAPDMAPFRNQLALSLLSSGQDDQAMSELATAIDLDENQFQSDYIKVMYALQQGDYGEAKAAIERILETNPDNPIGHNLRGALYLNDQDPAAAEQSFRKALELDPGFAPARRNLAALLESTQGADAAREVYAAGLAQESGGESAALAMVDFHARQGEVEEALQLLDATIVKFPDSIPARLGQTRLLLATRQYDAASQAAEDLLQRAPQQPDALLLKGRLDLLVGDMNSAREMASRLQTQRDVIANNPIMLSELGELQLRTGSLTLARNNLQAALDLPDTQPGTRLAMAQLELAEGNANEAEAQLQSLRDAGIQAEEVEILAADIHLTRRDPQAASDVLKNLADSGSRTAVIRYALLQSDLDQADNAEEVLEGWLQQNPDDSGARMALANVGIRSGEMAAAKAQYEAMLPSTNPVLLNNLAWIYFEEGDDRAEDMARRAVQQMPDNADMNDTLGWILVNKDNVSEGLRLLRNSSRAQPNNPTISYHLAEALFRAGDRVAAKEAVQRALSVSGEFDGRSEAEALLGKLN
ncbi:MAG: XrtA/PEP-CTERM system TPR-repeat protein PrsT [Pseudomonadota bacterium]